MPDAIPALVIEQHAPLVRQIATTIKRKYRLRLEQEELEAAGLEGLVQAYRNFNPERGAAFSTFAYHRIRGAILDNCRRLGAMRRLYKTGTFECAANEVLGAAAQREPSGGGKSSWIVNTLDDLATAYLLTDDLEEVPASDPAPDQTAHTRQLSGRLAIAFAALSPEEREVLERYYLRDESMREIARSRNVSTSWVSRVHRRTLEKLRPMLSEKNRS